jgi:oligoendopeptidase F
MLAGRAQIISNARTTRLFVEAPSTANELLLGNYILDTTADPRLRRWVILQFLGTFMHNMVTHLLEAHLEQRLYDLAEAGQPLTLATIMQAQGEVLERYFAGTVNVDDGARLNWMQVPHFYVGLYPFTYAAGLSSAHAVVEAIRTAGQPAVDRWLRTLAAGGTLPPLELMQLAGVDMASPEPLRRAVAFFGSLVDELEKGFAD